MIHAALWVIAFVVLAIVAVICLAIVAWLFLMGSALVIGVWQKQPCETFTRKGLRWLVVLALFVGAYAVTALVRSVFPR